MKLTSLDDVIKAIVAQLESTVDYPVYDGPPKKHPTRSVEKYIVVGSAEPYIDDNLDPVNTAMMQQTWSGLGQRARDEALQIPCVATGKAPTIAAARPVALAAGQDAFDTLGKNPTPETYNALVSDVASAEANYSAGQAVVTVRFTISASARLV